MTSERIEEAAKRVANSVDAILVAKAYLDRLAANEAAAVERAKPLDEKWLRSVGFTGPWSGCESDEVATEAIYGGGYLSWSPMRGCRLCDLHLGITTRGQLLDLLSALGVSVKGGE